MSIKDSQKLKQLQSRKAKLEVLIQQLKDNRKEIQQYLSKEEQRLRSIVEEIESLSKKEPIVSEHAILRYLERCQEIEIDKIKRKILNQSTVEQIKYFGDGKYPIGNGHQAVVKDMTVVSVV